LERKSSSFNPYRVFKFVATAYDVISATIEKSFQSLSGFQVRCNMAASAVLLTFAPVSIPIGFSSSLQLKSQLKSLPEGVQFQSLSGFQVRCNGTL